jgi:hypothetical protein
MLSTRNPYPYPRYESDEQFAGGTCTQHRSYDKPPHLAQREDPWYRLSNTGTLSSVRREAVHFDPEAPRDSLDFALKTEYNHHQEFLKDKNETVLQKETLGKPHNRILKNKTVFVPAEKPRQGHPVRVVESPTRNNPFSVKNAISSHHSQTTNVGYSRKPDGGYYAS